MQSQLEEAAESREREKLKQTHQLADTTFRVNNIFSCFNVTNFSVLLARIQ